MPRRFNLIGLISLCIAAGIVTSEFVLLLIQARAVGVGSYFIASIAGDARGAIELLGGGAALIVGIIGLSRRRLSKTFAAVAITIVAVLWIQTAGATLYEQLITISLY